MENSVGGRIRAVRESMGLSGAVLAQRINLSQPYLSEIERGKKNPSLDVLREEISERGKKQEESTGKLREGLEREKNRIEVRRNALAEAVLDGSIPRDVARRKQEELTTGLSEIERQLEALDVAPPPHPIEELRNIPAHAIEKALETDKGLRSIFVALVARVEMTPEHRGKICFTGLYPPEEIAVPRRRGQKPPIA